MRAGKLQEHHGSSRLAMKLQGMMAGGVVCALIASTLVVMWQGLPRMDFGSAVLRPDKSEAFDVFEDVEKRLLNVSAEPNRNVPLIFAAADAPTLRQSILAAQKLLQSEEVEGSILPLALVPDAAAQTTNLQLLQALTTREATLKQAIDTAGFTAVAFALTQNVLQQWRTWAATSSTLPFWPKANVLENLGGIVTQHEKHGLMALGSVRLTPGHSLETNTVLHKLEKIPGAHSTVGLSCALHWNLY